MFGLEAASTNAVTVGAAAATVLGRLRDGALTADELVRATSLEPGDLSAALVELELARLALLEDGVYRAAT